MSSKTDEAYNALVNVNADIAIIQRLLEVSIDNEWQPEEFYLVAELKKKSDELDAILHHGGVA